METRGMQGFVLSRASSEDVTLIYYSAIENEDGSSTLYPEEVPTKGSIAELQPKDIERLEKAGIIVRKGITIGIPEAREAAPDTVIYNGKNYRVANWAAKKESDNISVVATCDETTIAGDDREYEDFPEA
jgi:hypothetical protein